MKGISVLITTFILSIFVITAQADPPEKILKKINKEIRSNYPSIIIEKISIDTIDHNIGSNNGYKFYSYYLEHNNTKVGTIFYTQALGRFDLFDFLVIFNNESVIKKVKVIQYLSPHGGEISSKGFLKQFLNKPDAEDYRYLKEINGISGATISGNAITKEINRLHKIVKKLNNR